MDIVLGVSMAPSTIRMVLVEGENADGVTVDQDHFDTSPNGDSANSSATDQVIAAILGTRQGAVAGGYRLTSTGVTWSDQIEGAALRDALSARKIENVMLVSAFLAAAALAQAVGNATGYTHTALLFVEPDTATLAVVDTADGSIADVHRRSLPADDDEAVAALVEMVSGADGLDARPEGLFVVGSGVDIPMIKPALEAATWLPVSAPEEPDMALARGAALASANAPLFASSTAALAYAQDPGTGEVNPYLLAGYLAVPDVPAGADLGDEDLAYSAVPDGEAEAFTAAGPDADAVVADEDEILDSGLFDFRAARVEQPSRRPFVAAMSVLAIFVVGVVALVISLAFSIRPSVALRPNPGNNVVAPPGPSAPAPAAPPPAPAAPAPAPAPAAPAPAPAAPAPAPAAPAPAPPPVAPAPVAPAPAAPPPLPPVIPRLPPIFSPPVQGPPVHPGGGPGWGPGRGGGWGTGGHGGGWGPGGHGGGGGFGIPGIPGL